MKIKLIKEELASIDLEKDYSKFQYKEILKRIEKIVNPSLCGMKIIEDENFDGMFKLVESEISDKKIKSFSFPNLSYEQRMNCYGKDALPIKLEFQDETIHEVLCTKGIELKDESELSNEEINEAVELGK